MAEVAPEGESILALARRLTESVHGAVIVGKQPREWLCQLMNNPATLPLYSLMVSSIGVTPIEVSYGQVDVECVFSFRGFLHTQAPSQSQATMVHALTYAGKLNCMVSFTSPGVSRRFAEETAKRIKSVLVPMAQDKESL
jgi:hypothetical protein